jgi:ATP-dependent DNA helicase RecG
MFMLIGGGDQAGSGYARIQEGWKSQHWRAPLLATQTTPDRVVLRMPMISLMPHETFVALRQRIGPKLDKLSEGERLALATAAIEGGVTNTRMQDLVSDHPSDITKILRGLVNDELLQSESHGRWKRYRLPSEIGGRPDLFKSVASATPTPSRGGDPTPTWGGGSPTEEQMQATAARVSDRPKADRTLVEQVILELCRGQFLTPQQLSALLHRGGKKLRENYLTPMVNDGRLERLYPAASGRPDQAYRTVQAKSDIDP